jgi:hypothetical protein
VVAFSGGASGLAREGAWTQVPGRGEDQQPALGPGRQTGGGKAPIPREGRRWGEGAGDSRRQAGRRGRVSFVFCGLKPLESTKRGLKPLKADGPLWRQFDAQEEES